MASIPATITAAGAIWVGLSNKKGIRAVATSVNGIQKQLIERAHDAGLKEGKAAGVEEERVREERRKEERRKNKALWPEERERRERERRHENGYEDKKEGA